MITRSRRLRSLGHAARKGRQEMKGNFGVETCYKTFTCETEGEMGR